MRTNRQREKKRGTPQESLEESSEDQSENQRDMLKGEQRCPKGARRAERSWRGGMIRMEKREAPKTPLKEPSRAAKGTRQVLNLQRH